jgi:hypothetical protein
MQGRDYIQFGDLRLPVVGGLHGFDGAKGYDYGQYSPATGKPMIAPAGERLRQVCLRISLRYYLGDDVAKTVEIIDKMLASGNAHDLIFANGFYQGKYVIENVRDTIKSTLPDGTVNEYDATIDLIEFAERIILVENTQKKSVPKQKGNLTKSQKTKKVQQKASGGGGSPMYFDAKIA